jgi:DNA-binding NarL/FixJ family response regulator
LVELELRLRHIGAEVRAAGLLGDIESMPRTEEFAQLAQLTSRQWEILVRLLRGDRVSTIARNLFVGQSTVRNHLSATFRLFGVHSQAELLALLREGAKAPRC